MLEHAHWMAPNHLQMDKLRGNFPSPTLCLSFILLSVIEGNLLRAADCFALVLAFSLGNCVCLCILTCAFIPLCVYSQYEALSLCWVILLDTATYAIQAIWFITLALPHTRICLEI